MSCSEDIFEIAGDDGLVRRGILTRGSGGARAAVVLLPAGLKYHVGPHRMNVVLARQLADAGYLVLRFDPLGVGESDGQLHAGPTGRLWREIGEGQFVPDILLVCRRLREQFGLDTVVLGGLCGGAINAQLAAAAAPDVVQGVFSIGAPLTLPPAEAQPQAAPSAHLARQVSRNYAKKLFSPDAWSRVLSGRTNFRGALAMVSAAVRSWLGPKDPGGEESFPNENPLFMTSFRRLQDKGVPQLLVFGRGDNRWLEFEAGVVQRFLSGRLSGKGYEVHLIPDANHELYLAHWTQQALAAIGEWTARHFPAGPAAPATAAGNRT